MGLWPNALKSLLLVGIFGILSCRRVAVVPSIKEFVALECAVLGIDKNSCRKHCCSNMGKGRTSVELLLCEGVRLDGCL